LMCTFGDKVDKMLLRKVKDDETRQLLVLALELKDIGNVSSTALQYMPNELKEEMLGTSDIDPENFIKTLSESKDLAWINRMITNAINGILKLKKSSATFDTEIIKFFSNMTEDICLNIVKLRDYMPNAISHKVLSWILVYKDFSEDDLILIKDVFKSAGMYFELKRFAKRKEFDKLLSML